MNRPPCYQCDNRSVGCHAKCEVYLQWQQKTKEDRMEYMKKHGNKIYHGYMLEVGKRFEREERKRRR